MNTQFCVALLKQLAGVAGVVGASVLIGLPALAQSEGGIETSNESSIEIAQSPDAGSDFELSPEGLTILCERFPLNSRCAGGTVDTAPTSVPPIEEPRPGDLSQPNITPEPDASTPYDAPSPSSPYESTPSAPSSGMEPEMEPEMEPMTPAPATEPMTPDMDSTVPDNGKVEGSLEPEAAAPVDSAVEVAQAPADAEMEAPEVEAPEADMSEPAPEAPAMETPEMAPAAPMGSAVTPEELEQFASAIPQLQAIEQTTQAQINQAIENTGISRDRLGELYQAQQTPDAEGVAEVTPEEQESLDTFLAELQTIEQENQAQQLEVIQASGLEPARFQEILAVVRQDPGLQQQLRQIMQN